MPAQVNLKKNIMLFSYLEFAMSSLAHCNFKIVAMNARSAGVELVFSKRMIQVRI